MISLAVEDLLTRINDEAAAAELEAAILAKAPARKCTCAASATAFASFLEVYNEQLNDLLVAESTNLKLFERADGGVLVPG